MYKCQPPSPRLIKMTIQFEHMIQQNHTRHHLYILLQCLSIKQKITQPHPVLAHSTTLFHLKLTDFWANVFKTVRPMLSVRCLSCLSVMSVTFVHCGQMVGRIKMKLGMHVGLGAGHTVLHGDPAPPPQRGIAPNFRPMFIVAKRLDG